MGEILKYSTKMPKYVNKLAMRLELSERSTSRRLRSGSAAADRGRSAERSSARTDRAHISAHEAQTMDTEDPKGGPCHAENAQKAIFCQ